MDLFNIFNINLIIKVIFLLVTGMYSVFAFVVFNQIRAMNTIVYVPNSSRILSFTSIAHLIFALSLFLTALAIL